MKPKDLAMLIASLLLVSVAVLTGSCTEQSEAPTQTIADVDAREAFNLIQKNQDNPDFVIVDVRTHEEFIDGHIEDAINIDFRSDSFNGEISRLDTDKTYLIYCRSGNRSRGALEVMIELGFMEVYHLSAGIIGWLDEGLPTVK